MTTLTKIVRRVTQEVDGYGRNARRLVVAFEKGDLIPIRELGRRTKHTARLYDALWWMLRCQADKVRIEKLRERKTKNIRTTRSAPPTRCQAAVVPSQFTRRGERMNPTTFRPGIGMHVITESHLMK